MIECTEAVAERLARAEGFVFDMDGTLVLGDRANHGLRPLPGAVELTRWLREHDIPFLVCTNGTTRPPDAYAADLAALGFPVAVDDVVTPASAAADLFARRGHTRVMTLGGDGLRRPLQDAGISTVAPVKQSGADAVLAGWFREVTFADLEAACDAVWAGAAFYSASQSRFFATAQGRALGTSRAISAVVRDLTDTHVEIVGKPSTHVLDVTLARTGVDPARLVVVGDDPELEMAMAHEGGCLAVAVATGVHAVTDPDALAALPPEHSPDLALPGVDHLLRLLRTG